jgi:hypothetical protein
MDRENVTLLVAPGCHIPQTTRRTKEPEEKNNSLALTPFYSTVARREAPQDARTMKLVGILM